MQFDSPCRAAPKPDPSHRFVYPGPDGKLIYDQDDRGNRLPDFSQAGYGGGGVAIPDVSARIEITPAHDDSTARIQAALDQLANQPVDGNGIRGAVLLKAGRHFVAGQLRLRATGVVLRGEGDATTVVATGQDRRTLIRVFGELDSLRDDGPTQPIVDEFVPVGATRLRLASASGFTVGDTVRIEHPSTKQWIAALGMNRFPSSNVGSWLDWQPGKLDFRFERTIAAVDGTTLTLDAPLTAGLDMQLSPCRVVKSSWPGRIYNVGIERLQLESEFDRANPRDEEHAWDAICLENVRDAWVRGVSFRHFAGSAVRAWESSSRITVEDCISREPVSALAGQRRQTYFTAGQQTLFQRCRAENGRHDFAVGYLAAGPNAFVDCHAQRATSFSGPIESWATGVLFDNVTIDGGGLSLTNRETDAHGVGWAAANCVLWNCVAPLITCRKPPTAQNWAIACWGEFVGDGHWRSLNEFEKPDSLYRAQLAERGMRHRVVNHDAVRPATILADRTSKPLALQNGWLTCDGKLLTGSRVGTQWWRGHALPSRATEAGLGVTRFVPGRIGPGFTDDLAELADALVAKHQVVLEHHWGLWYDRRRDDHQMVRRATGDVWPPFYEQPWARSGEGTAWDGLSQYDLTKFNAWYFSRLREFARQCHRTGRVFFQQMYFQHNVLEAGAHWADFPWRPANCRQATGFPEPPVYENRKRVFMATEFYDVTHPVRRELHRAYIRHCLDTLGDQANVVFFTGEEFTGPLAFVEFWLDTIAEWQQEQDRRVLVGLACTKDVQDAILADPKREPLIAVIDMKYWWYTAAGGSFAPPGEARLAPRQQLREWQGGKSRSDGQLARQVREYRERFPRKAIVSALEPANPWLMLAAGGSLVRLPPQTDPRLLAALAKTQLTVSKPLDSAWLSEAGQTYFVATTNPAQIDLRAETATFAIAKVDPRTGQATTQAETARGGQVLKLSPSGSGVELWWLLRT